MYNKIPIYPIFYLLKGDYTYFRSFGFKEIHCLVLNWEGGKGDP